MAEDVEFFTRADWRPGKRGRLRVRTKPWGGQKTASAAFIEAGKPTRFKPGRPGVRLCTATKRDGKPCGNLALHDMKVCGYHGGYGQWARQGRLVRSGKTAEAKARRAAMIETRSMAIPRELSRMQTFLQASQWDKMRLAKAWLSPAFPRLLEQVKQHITHGCV